MWNASSSKSDIPKLSNYSAIEHMVRHKMLFNCPQKSLLPSKMAYKAWHANILSDIVLKKSVFVLLARFWTKKAVFSPAYHTLF